MPSSALRNAILRGSSPRSIAGFSAADAKQKTAVCSRDEREILVLHPRGEHLSRIVEPVGIRPEGNREGGSQLQCLRALKIFWNGEIQEQSFRWNGGSFRSGINVSAPRLIRRRRNRISRRREQRTDDLLPVRCIQRCCIFAGQCCFPCDHILHVPVEVRPACTMRSQPELRPSVMDRGLPCSRPRNLHPTHIERRLSPAFS